VLIGDALVHENERLQARINQLMDRLEATLRQCLRVAATQGEVRADVDANAAANLLLAFVVGRWHQFAKSGFKRSPLEYLDQQKQLLWQSF
jgi:TetR/AcrR family transcriptional regulator